MSKNPMKPAETEKPDFASEEAGELAVKLNNDGKISTEEIAALKGEGKDGAITVDDIEKALEEKEAAAAAEAEKANDDGDNIVFTTEDVAAFAAEQADKIGFAITDIVGTAKQPPGAIGKKDVDNHIKSIEKAKKAEEKAAEKESEAESKAKEAAAAAEAEKANDDGDNIVFTTEDVAAFAAEQADKIGFAITDIVGTAKQPPGAIGKKDVDNHIKSIEKAKKAEEKAAEKESEAESKAKDESEDEEGELTLESFFERFMQFSIPVRGALNTKPKVQGQWNKLIADAVKLQKQL